MYRQRAKERNSKKEEKESKRKVRGNEVERKA
jgi:hypothetical protein